MVIRPRWLLGRIDYSLLAGLSGVGLYLGEGYRPQIVLAAAQGRAKRNPRDREAPRAKGEGQLV